MFQRNISRDDVHHVLATEEIIERYPRDTPYPSRLLLGWPDSRPIHVVAAENLAENLTIVITVYEPTTEHWRPGFKERLP